MTSKLQVTIPRAIADRLSIVPGDELDWIPGDDSVRIVPARSRRRAVGVAPRLALFDAATARQRQREAAEPREVGVATRGWSREELYERGGPR